ncbi:MAG: hypothetical protein PHQ81_06125 [Methanofollis sp.]|nr:hypothetical protein [Methanofollis sp.]
MKEDLRAVEKISDLHVVPLQPPFTEDQRTESQDVEDTKRVRNQKEYAMIPLLQIKEKEEALSLGLLF